MSKALREQIEDAIRRTDPINDAYHLIEKLRSVLDDSLTNHGLDTDERVCFYEQEFYVLSNFSAFAIYWPVEGVETRFDTSEALYHWHKFPKSPGLQLDIRTAPSAHEAFKIAEANREYRRPDWDAVKVDIMRRILHAKVEQHPYVRKKLLETGDRQLVENSWRDGFWGWGEDRKGKNMLGILWTEIRYQLSGKMWRESQEKLRGTP